jgi:hypothetical protein
LIQLINQLPDEKLNELEQLVISMLRSEAAPVPPHPRMSFEEAQAYTFKTIGKTLKRLAE